MPRALATVDVASGEPAQAISQRSDVCAVPAAAVVAEAMVALVLADAALEKFGGDSVAETARNGEPLARPHVGAGEGLLQVDFAAASRDARYAFGVDGFDDTLPRPARLQRPRPRTRCRRAV